VDASKSAPVGGAQAGDASPEKPIDPRRIALLMVGGMIVFTAIFAGLGYFFREPLISAAEYFVASLGGFGVAIGFFLPDAFTIPLPNDAFSALGLAGGIDFWEVVAWSSGGSVLGGLTGFTIGRRLARTRWLRKKLTSGQGAAMHALIERYGAAGLAVAACTPLPYSLATWAAGTSRLTYTQCLLISLPLRTGRVAAMLWLVQVGLNVGAN